MVFSESQNGSGWKGLLEVMLSNPFKQGYIEQVAQDFQYSSEGDTATSFATSLFGLCLSLITLTV